MSIGEKCWHGKKWKDECLECDLINAQEAVRNFQPIIDKNRRLIEEILKKIEERDNETRGTDTALF